MMRMIMRKPLIDDPITNVERVAVELRTLRRARNITQQTLADRAQVARRTLTHADSAQNVGIQEWCRIANALGYELTLKPQNTVVFEELPDVLKEEECIHRRLSILHNSSIKSVNVRSTPLKV